jgi:hypothetical protein
VPADSSSAIPGTPKLDENSPSRQELIELLKDHVDASHLELLTYDELLKVCEHYNIQLDEYNAADPCQGPGVDDSQSPIHGKARVDISDLDSPAPMSMSEQREQRLMAVRLAEMKRAGYFN